MIKYIRYDRDGGVEIYDGHLQVEKFVLSDITNAIIHRLNAIQELDITRSNHQHSEETCFLVRLAYDFDKFEQYFEKFNDDLILNFCNKKLVSIYSIQFRMKNHFSKEVIFKQSWDIKFSNQILAPLITIKEIREKIIRLDFSYLKIGRRFWSNNLYYQYNDTGFCLPIEQLVYDMEKTGKIEKYIRDINIKIEDICRVSIEIRTLRHAYGKRDWENIYYGYLDLDKFEFIIETHTEELLSS